MTRGMGRMKRIEKTLTVAQSQTALWSERESCLRADRAMRGAISRSQSRGGSEALKSETCIVKCASGCAGWEEGNGRNKGERIGE